MTKLLDVVIQATEQATGMSKDQLVAFANADSSVLHDPFLLDGMEELVDNLHQFAEYQKQYPEMLCIVDTDYDADGVMSALEASGGLSVFGINHRVYAPSRADGYGLNRKAVDDIIDRYKNVGMILTGDNGSKAFEGVEYAQSLGIPVLVTDHHLAHGDLAPASVVVNPNKDGDNYPFKGNAGAAVVWKLMMAYASKYDVLAKPLIEDLIVFAGIANVSDVMPILDENHYMVKQAVRRIRELIDIKHKGFPRGNPLTYQRVSNTGIAGYDTVFHGLFDLIHGIQEYKDNIQIAKGSKPKPLKDNEELIGWYISPTINAVGRVRGETITAFAGVLSPLPQERMAAIHQMMEDNDYKSMLRDAVIDQIEPSKHFGTNGNVLFVNARAGIVGLIAGRVAERTGNASCVFGRELPTNITVFEPNFIEDAPEDLRISCSARSNELQPLHIIFERINERCPHMQLQGGGHAGAAGYSILYKYAAEFRQVFDRVAGEVKVEMERLAAENPDAIVFANIVPISLQERKGCINISNIENLKAQCLEVLDFQDSIRPFGKDFDGQTKFLLQFTPRDLNETPQIQTQWTFWGGKSFKFTMNGIAALTFDTKFADTVKRALATEPDTVFECECTLDKNEFRGTVTPQLMMSGGRKVDE